MTPEPLQRGTVYLLYFDRPIRAGSPATLAGRIKKIARFASSLVR